jgi:cytoskeletal protein RodZ
MKQEFSSLNKRRNDNQGFGVVGLLILLIVVVLVAAIGLFVYNRHRLNTQQTNTNNTATSSSSVTKIASPDDKVSFEIPSNWHVVYNVDTFKPGQAITQVNGSLPSCLNPDDQSACLYIANVQPVAVKAGGPVWWFSLEQSSLTPQQAAQTFEGLSAATNEKLSPIRYYYSKFKQH